MNTESSSSPRLLAAVSLALGLVLVLVPAALAAKGGNGGSGGKPSGEPSTVSLTLLDSTDGPHFGQRVTFDVVTTATDHPYVTLRCYQGGAFVYQLTNAMFETSLNQVFTLGPTPSWTGGAANCTAELHTWMAKNGRVATLASTSFDVLA